MKSQRDDVVNKRLDKVELDYYQYVCYKHDISIVCIVVIVNIFIKQDVFSHFVSAELSDKVQM